MGKTTDTRADGPASIAGIPRLLTTEHHCHGVPGERSPRT